VSLMNRLGELGVTAMSETIDSIKKGEIARISQTGEPSHAPMLSKADSELDFTNTAEQVHNKVRGLALGPHARAQVLAGGRKMQVLVLKTGLSQECLSAPCAAIGQITRIERGRGFFVKCSDREILISMVRPENKNTMPAVDFINGFRLNAGDYFSAKQLK
ncbi:MAG: hypothetical protein NTW04_01110, partial [Elusimicrobia bacterium]|nr:hypothetical protein [Elusimicrobiota bacterium]